MIMGFVARFLFCDTNVRRDYLRVTDRYREANLGWINRSDESSLTCRPAFELFRWIFDGVTTPGIPAKSFVFRVISFRRWSCAVARMMASGGLSFILLPQRNALPLQYPVRC